MLQALVVPAFALAWPDRADRLLAVRQLLLAGAAMSARPAGGCDRLAGPAGWRPYIGGSQTNSILELTLGYNGFGRLNREVGSVGGGGAPAGGTGMWGATGFTRLHRRERRAGRLADAGRPDAAGRRARVHAGGPPAPIGPRCPMGRVAGGYRRHLQLHGRHHAYYEVVLAPAIGAGRQRRCCGAGVVSMWCSPARRRHAAVVRPARPEYDLRRTRPLVLVLGLVAVVALIAIPLLTERLRQVSWLPRVVVAARRRRGLGPGRSGRTRWTPRPPGTPARSTAGPAVAGMARAARQLGVSRGWRLVARVIRPAVVAPGQVPRCPARRWWYRRSAALAAWPVVPAPWTGRLRRWGRRLLNASTRRRAAAEGQRLYTWRRRSVRRVRTSSPRRSR